MKDKYKPTAEQLSKLRSLASRQNHCYQAAREAWRDRDYDQAVKLFEEGNAVNAQLNAYFGKLCNWRSHGVPASYAK